MTSSGRVRRGIPTGGWQGGVAETSSKGDRAVDQIKEQGQHNSSEIHAKKQGQNSNAAHPFSSVTHSFYDRFKTSSFS
jgi:hypothetical protein